MRPISDSSARCCSWYGWRKELGKRPPRASPITRAVSSPTRFSIWFQRRVSRMRFRLHWRRCSRIFSVLPDFVAGERGQFRSQGAHWQVSLSRMWSNETRWSLLRPDLQGSAKVFTNVFSTSGASACRTSAALRRSPGMCFLLGYKGPFLGIQKTKVFFLIRNDFSGYQKFVLDIFGGQRGHINCTIVLDIF